MSLMKAALHEKYGTPDVLHVTYIHRPVPSDHEVLIKVHATTVNRTDCALLKATPYIIRFFTGWLKPKNPISGTDFAGEVESIGKLVSKFKVWDKVFGFNDIGVSSHAQYMTIAEDKAIVHMPENVSYEDAVAGLEGTHYAYNFLTKVNIQSGHKILVNGADGAIGSALVQLLKYRDVHITAVCNPKNIELVKSLGAYEVFDYSREDFTQSGEKYQIVFDAVGKSTFAQCKPLLENGGIYSSSELGPNNQNVFYALTTPVTSILPGKHQGKKVIFPIPFDCKRSVLLIKQWIEEGKLQAVIDRKYPLEKIADAYRYVDSGQKTGSVIITIHHNN